MALEIAGMAVKAVETGKKIVEVAKKAEKVISAAEKPVRAAEKVTSEKDGNWGADIVKSGVQKVAGEIKGGLADKLKDYLEKDDITSDVSEINADTGESTDIKGDREDGDSKESKNSLKDRLNKYLDSLESQSDNDEDDQNDNLNQDNEKNNESNETTKVDDGNDSSENIKNDDESKEGLTDEEKLRIKEETGWSDEVINHIGSWEEYEIYKKAGLQEVEIGGKKCLIRGDIDWDQVDEKGRTNTERVKRGLAPLDKNGDAIQLHHIGQHEDSPLAELTFEEHRCNGNDTILHDKTKETEIHGAGNTWDSERQTYWKDRADYNEGVNNNG